MDSDRSFERRYSFNASTRNPAAESTKLNHSNANRSGLGISFKWGLTPISRKQRCNSSVNISNVDMTMGHDHLHHRSLRKIDSRVAADVQSQGLAFRIVKYHENGSRLNRSMSANNLCTKPGQFPVITLKKTDLPYRATTQNVSMTRIAPPEKSVFYGSTLSSLWRSNSVVGLHKSDEDISRENRPIIHPPPTENDMVPTRSVLDVLKEISRKRINIDDPDVMETSKKNRLGNVLVDTEAQTVMTHNFKRQRDLNSSHNDDIYSPTKCANSRVSPAKKRICNYNNDITSSLSSSIDRRPNIKKRPSNQHNHTIPNRLELYAIQKNKNSKSYNLENTASKVDGLINNNGLTSTNLSAKNMYGAIPPRSNTEPTFVENARPATANSKPRLTLFNKVYEPDSSSKEIAVEADGLDESSEFAGIQFVKPKKLTSSVGLKNPIIERAQKSKLALMLSALKGELCNENDEVDYSQPQQDIIHKNKTKNVDEKQLDAGNKVTITEVIVLPATNPTISGIPAIASIASSQVPDKPETTNSNTHSAIKSPSSSSSPLVGIKLTPPTTSKPLKITNTQKVDFPLNVSSAPILQGFATTSSTEPATTAAIGTPIRFGASTQPSFAFQPVLDPQKDKNKSNEAIHSSSNQNASGSFGNTSKTSTATAGVVANNFSFPAANITAATVPATTAIASVPTYSASTPVPSTSANASSARLANTFSFGSNAATTTASGTTAAFSFGLPSTAPKTSIAPTVIPSGGFSFGNKTTATVANSTFSHNTAPVLAFGFSNNDKTSTINPETPKEALAFTSTSEATTASFAHTSTPPPPFGSTAVTTASNVFGSSNVQSQPNVFGPPNSSRQSLFASGASKQTFGSESSKPPPSIFGGTSSNKPEAANREFSFVSATTAAPSGGSFTFGASNGARHANNSNAAPAANGASTAFSFVASAMASERNTSNNIFGGAPPNAASGDFLFGSEQNPAVVTKPAETPSGSIFGSVSKPSTFTFGAANSSPSAVNTSISSTPGGFAFGSGLQQKSNCITSAKPFSFGAPASTNNQAVGSTNNNSVANNMFASNIMNKPAAPAFNFGASAAPCTPPQASAASAAANNIFASSPTMMAAGAGDRHIRRATRRLQK